MATLSSGSKIKFEYMLGGGPPAVITVPAQADTTGWAGGAILFLDASGHADIHATGAAGTTTFGVAAHPSATSITTDAAADQMIYLPTPMSVFSIAVTHSTTGSAKPAWTQIHNVYGITNAGTKSASSDCWVLDIETSGTAGGYVLGLQDTTDTIHGRVYFIFHGSLFSTNSVWFTAGAD